MGNEVFEKAGFDHLDENMEKPEKISESGKGLAVIKEFMDRISYKSDDERNRLIMIKYYKAHQ